MTERGVKPKHLKCGLVSAFTCFSDGRFRRECVVCYLRGLESDNPKESDMLARYKMCRGPRPPDDPLPRGIHSDSRYKTKHCLRPAKEDVDEYLADPNDEVWRQFKKKYLMLLETRFASERGLFDKLAEQARADDVWLGCSCPTKLNPNVYHCHTVLALQFMKKKYPDLEVIFPRQG